MLFAFYAPGLTVKPDIKRSKHALMLFIDSHHARASEHACYVERHGGW
jgi:hypothetical protein